MFNFLGLRYNLISFNQLRDSGSFKVTFSPTRYSVFDKSDSQYYHVLENKMCILAIFLTYVDNVCFMSSNDDPWLWLWYRRLGINMKLIKNISSKDNVRGLPKLKFVKDHM